MLVNGKIFMPQRVSDKYCIEPTRSEEVRKLYTDEYFISLIPEGCYYFAFDEEKEKVYSLGRDYKFEVEKKQKQLQEQLALTEKALELACETLSKMGSDDCWGCVYQLTPLCEACKIGKLNDYFITKAKEKESE